MPTIAYVSQEFPSLTMTFIYREVMALRRHGLNVRPISTWRPKREALSEEAAELVQETFYIFPLHGLGLLGTHLRYLVTRPARYLTTLAQLVVLNHESIGKRWRLLLHFSYAVRAAAEIERSGVQHIHADFALNAGTVALVASRLTGKPFSFAAHAADIFVSPILLKEKLAAARFVVAISEYNKRYLAELAQDGGAPQKIQIVRYGLRVDQFTPQQRQMPNARPLLLSVGRLVEKKGQRYLVEACAILAKQGYDFECTVIGQGPEEADLRALVAEHALTEQIHLEGALPQERVREWLGRADVFALPCVVASNRDQDGIPVALIEAMAMGIPVVSTWLSGIPELIQDGVNGLLVPPRDSNALARALARLLEDQDLRSQFGQAGRATVTRKHDIERNAAQLAALFRASIRENRAQ